MSQQCTPPQDTRVRLSYTTKEEAGRFAVASQALSPGELVLAAAPYGLVMNPKFCPSALYLSARCTTSANATAVDASSSSGENSAETGHHARGGKANKTAGKANKKSAAKHGARGEVAETQFLAHYRDALYNTETNSCGAASYQQQSAQHGDAASTRWYTTQSTWCAVCFQEISAGRWLCNRGTLAELAVDMSREQEELVDKVRAIEAEEEAEKAKSKKSRNGATGNADGNTNNASTTHMDDKSDVEDEEKSGDSDVDEAAEATTSAALRKLKKPSKSAKTRKDGAVELKQKLLEKALAQREEIFYERRLQRRARAAAGCPEVRLEGWEAINTGSNSSPAFLPAAAGALSGCSGCGVLCYCSEACWRAHHVEHVRSGECAVLRGLYPRLMAEFYATSAAAEKSPLGVQGTVVLPGDEALHWTRSSSEAKMLEFQSLLFGAVALARACRDGYEHHLGSEDEKPAPAVVVAADASTTTPATTGALKNGEEGVKKGEEHVEVTGEEKCAAVDGTSNPSSFSLPAAGPATNGSSAAAAVDSITVPREVLTIQEIRSKAGLTGTVEVLDSDPELRRQATGNDFTAIPVTCVSTRGATSTCEATTGTSEQPSDAIAETSPQLCARQPRYADMAQMETNLSVISKVRRSTYQRYYRTFVKRVLPTLHALRLLSKGGSSTEAVGAAAASAAERVPHTAVSESYFLRLCAAAQCNSFGVYDTQDHCIAFGMYPEASYFNHSCAPNVCRVMHGGGRLACFYALRNIAEGEPLTISYTDVEEQNSAERRRNLLETYRFFCLCERCSGHTEGPTMAVGASTKTCRAPVSSASNTQQSSGSSGGGVAATAVAAAVFEKPLLLCAQCAIRGYLRPIVSEKKIASAKREKGTWTMRDVAVRECTMCHRRVVREEVESA